MDRIVWRRRHRPVDQIMQLEPIDNQTTQAAPIEPHGGRRLSPRRLAVMLIVVVLAAAIVSGFLGALAATGYAISVGDLEGPPHRPWIGPTGVGGGVLLGVLAAIWWVRRMVRRAREGRLLTPAGTGAFFGLLAGLGATLVLHVMLSFAGGGVRIHWIAIGLCCAAAAGPLLGAIVSGLVPWACGKSHTAAELEQGRAGSARL